MNLPKILEELREELALLDELLIGFDKLALKRGPSRGRPPAWSKVAGATAPKSGNGPNDSMNGSPRVTAYAGKSAN